MERLIFPTTKKEAEKSGIPYSSEANKKALFPSQLRELRKKKGISQETLARDLGVSKSTIGLYETGDTLPDARTLRDLAIYFSVSADWLLGLAKNPTTDADINAMCEYSGLSEKAIGTLHRFSMRDERINILLSFINNFLEKDFVDRFDSAAFYAAALKKIYRDCVDISTELDDGIQIMAQLTRDEDKMKKEIIHRLYYNESANRMMEVPALNASELYEHQAENILRHAFSNTLWAVSFNAE